MENKKPNLRPTIVLNKPLERIEQDSTRWFADGKWLSMNRIIKLLTDSGYLVTHKKMPTWRRPLEFKGIKFKVHCGGLVLEPDEKDYLKLVDLLEKDGHFYRDCSLPKLK